MTLRPSKTRPTPTTDSKTAVAIYARYSTSGQDARSIDDQVRRCRAYAVAHGFDVAVEYSDAARSGANVERAGMQKLLTAARSRDGAPFEVVLVDDLSRLSRDLGDTWQIVFRDLASACVRVIDVTTGIASDGANARLTFGALALVNDQFLQLVRAETHRGLEGRALAGFSTGGHCYGYKAVQEDNPPDPEHPRKRLVIDAEEAEVVRRVFRLFVDGVSLKKLAATLNEERLAAPNDEGRGNKIGHGWGHTTIRAMLTNERYVGRVTWNQSKWIRVPGRKSRKRVMRPETEWVVQEYSELAVVAKALWDAAQARFQSRPRGPGRPPGTGRHVHLVSGLLRCGVCGGSMTVVGRKTKAGVSYARFGCTAHASRGAAVCSNALSVSERKASRTLVNALKEKLDRSEFVERFIRVFRERVAARGKQAPDAAEEAERQVHECERRIANLTESLARVGWSDALAAKLREEEATLARLKVVRSSRTSRQPRVIPHPAVVSGYLKNLLALLETDPVRGREVLARFVSPVVMTPELEGPERRYRATGAFNLSFLLTAAVQSEGRSGNDGCAGAICTR